MIKRKPAQCKLFWIVNAKVVAKVDIFLGEKWINKVIDISRVSDRM